MHFIEWDETVNVNEEWSSSSGQQQQQRDIYWAGRISMRIDK